MCILYHRARKHVNEHEQALNQTENRIGQQLTEQTNTKLSREHERAKERETVQKQRHECESNAKVTGNFHKHRVFEREREREKKDLVRRQQT